MSTMLMVVFPLMLATLTDRRDFGDDWPSSASSTASGFNGESTFSFTTEGDAISTMRMTA